jgi:ribosome-associated protein
MAAREKSIELTRKAAQAAGEKLGRDLVAIDLSEQMVLSEVFLLVTGGNEKQVEAIADEVERVLALGGEKPARKEKTANWILLDYSDLVVHIQSEELRSYYMLDRLWNDCPRIEIGDIERDQTESLDKSSKS